MNNNKILICNDASILFEEAFRYHTKHSKDVVIVSNSFKLLKKLAKVYADRHYPGEHKFNLCHMAIHTKHGEIYFKTHDGMEAPGLTIHKGFMLQDINDMDNTKHRIIKILARCRIR